MGLSPFLCNRLDSEEVFSSFIPPIEATTLFIL